MSGSQTELRALKAAYLELLRLPHGAVRARSQALFAGLRDEIAHISGRFAQDVQDDFEALASIPANTNTRDDAAEDAGSGVNRL